MLAAQALAALISEGASLGPPLVVPAALTWPEDLVAALDASYQDRLERLQVMRRRTAEAAWLVRDIKDQIDVLESAQARLDDRRRRALEAGRKEEAAKAADRLAAAQQEAAQARGMPVPWITEAERWLGHAAAAGGAADGCLPDPEGSAEGDLHRRARRAPGE